MAKLLYNNLFAPITSEFGFLECDVETGSNAFYEWKTRILRPYGQTVEMKSITKGPMDVILRLLLPLTDMHIRSLFIPTHGSWTAYFDNGWRGADPSSVISYLAELVGCRGLRVVWTPHTLKGRKGQLGAVVLEVYGRPNPILNIERSITLIHDGYKWDFETGGEPLPFEDTERYKAHRKTDRFTPEMLDAYLKELGIDGFSEDFYFATDDEPAKLVSIGGNLPHTMKEYSLEEARKDY